MSETHGQFYQFPLCLLAMDKPFDEVLSTAMGHGVVSFLDKTDGTVDWRRTTKSRADGLQKAQNVIGFAGGSIDAMIQHHGIAAAFRSQWLAAGNKTCDVRIRNDLMFGARDEDEPTERELRVLAGIFSAIGTKPYVKIGWQTIQCRAAGYLRTPNAPGKPLFPRGQVERTIAELLARNLVVGVTYRRGERFWSNRLTRDQLWHAIERRKLSRLQERTVLAKADATKSEALYALINVSAPINVSATCS